MARTPPMALTSGTRLGPYEITGPAGAGGMGEVYRAKDTRLDRTVAVKVLSTRLAERADLQKRFEREARTISKLSHPHICALYDVGHQEGVDFLVMEYLEGETLSHRLQRGSLPVEQALKYGVEIAAALETAHRQGIIHRDLKPGNVMLTKSGAKLMDFGLAKLAAQPAPVAVALPEMSTEAPPEESLTEEGVIVGTIQYMAPEQLEGKEADAGTDIFALGMVLYEMTTGRPAFTGKTKASVIAAILTSDPAPITQLESASPPELDYVVKTCLAKDPGERFQTARDVKLQLKWIAEGRSHVQALPVSRRKGRERLAWAVATALLLVSGWALWRGSRAVPQETMTFHAPLSFPVQDIALSPDGRMLAVVGYQDAAKKNVIWTYKVGSSLADSVPGTEGATYPFWSPDGRYIGFFADAKLKKVEVPNGQVQTICDAPTGRGGTWNQAGVILFAPRANGGGLFRVPASGGTPVRVTSPDPARLEFSHRWPAFLPDGNHYLFLAANFSGHPEVNAIFLGSLDSSQRRLIVQSSANVAYAAPGYLLFYRDRVLTAQSFDLQRLALAGEPVTLLNDVRFLPQVDRAVFAVAGSGLLVWQSSTRTANTELVWFDRSGKQRGSVGKPAIYGNVRLAPDGKMVACDITDLDTTNVDVWTLDLSRETAKRFTFDAGNDYVPIWSQDGRRLLFGSNRGQSLGVFVKNSDGSGDDKALLHEEVDNIPSDWSREGKYILYGHGSELWYLELPGLQTKPFLQTQSVQANGQFSPDGHWVAYASNETGRWEIYVTSFPEPHGKWQVSASGGQQPRWRGDGRELFYLSPDAVMMAVPVSLGAGVDAGRPAALFQAHPHQPILSADLFTYDVTADGQRFLINTSTGQTATAPLSVQLNWALELKK